MIKPHGSDSLMPLLVDDPARLEALQTEAAGLPSMTLSSAAAANAVMADLRARLPALPGQTAASLTVSAAEDFAYTDPIDGSVATGQGIILTYEGGARAMLRLSGTGTEGATLRVYLEQYAPPDGDLTRNTQEALADVIAATTQIAKIEEMLDHVGPDVVS